MTLERCRDAFEPLIFEPQAICTEPYQQEAASSLWVRDYATQAEASSKTIVCHTILLKLSLVLIDIETSGCYPWWETRLKTFPDGRRALRMPQLCLADLVDVVSRTGEQKARKLLEIKKRPKYDPKADFYKRIRETIVECHEKGLGKEHIHTDLGDLKDKKKRNHYPAVASAYESWWGRKRVNWFVPRASTWKSQGVEVSVNPELGLNINGFDYLIKLYFKRSRLESRQAQIVTHVMRQALAKHHPDAQMSVLDIRSGKLLCVNAPRLIGPVLEAEVAYIAAIWPLL